MIKCMPGPWEQLLHRSWRRFALAHIVRELAKRGVALLVLAVVAGSLEHYFAWAGLSPQLLLLAGVLLALDLARSLRHLPTPLQVALALDAQLGSHELFSTALALQHNQSSDKGFVAAILSQADSVAARIRQDQVRAGGYAARYWIMMLLCAGVMPMVWGEPAYHLDKQLPAENKLPEEILPQDMQTRQALLLRQLRQAGNLAPGSENIPSEELTKLEQRPETSPGTATARPGKSDFAGSTPGGGLAAGRGELPPIVPPLAAGHNFAPPTEASASIPGAGAAIPASEGKTASGQVTQTPSTPTPVTSGQTSLAPEAGQTEAQTPIPSKYQDVVKAYFRR